MERAGIVFLRHWNLLLFYLSGPESIGFLGLLCTFLSQVSVCPRYGVVAFELSPVIIPRCSAIVVFCYVVDAFSMPAHVQEFVLHIVTTFFVEM